MFARVQAGDLTAKIVGGLGFITVGGIAVCVNSMDFLHTVRQARKEGQERDRRYLQEMQDRRRSVQRVLTGYFDAETPAVEIPREQLQARNCSRHEAALCRVLVAAFCLTCAVGL